MNAATIGTVDPCIGGAHPAGTWARNVSDVRPGRRDVEHTK
ncbi:MAG: hypothetical protein JWP55_4320 [Mycobacterium sp.]|nr:hypothetical protein [Mycobacterium sp.]